MRKIVVALDSMKGCLDSLSASRAIAEGIKDSDRLVDVVCVPVADGGEGTAVALSFGNDNYQRMSSKVTGPIGMEINAEWYLDNQHGIAFIDMASAAGLVLLEESERNPMQTTTYGVGQLIMEAIAKGAGKIMLGLGGSATTDAGLGACQAMGLKLLDSNGNELRKPFTGKLLPAVNNVQISELQDEIKSVELFLLCDVTSPFTGADGAARVFGPQKGASHEDVEILENGMENIRRLIISKLNIDLNDVSGSGASGGAAGGLMAFAGGKIKMGAPILLDAIGFDHVIEDADMIVTGEGSSDNQTLMGKLPYEILQRGKRRHVPVWLVAGRVEDDETLLQAGFERVICINDQEILERSGTLGMNPLDPHVAARRLKTSMIALV